MQHNCWLVIVFETRLPFSRELVVKYCIWILLAQTWELSGHLPEELSLDFRTLEVGSTIGQFLETDECTTP